jgi:hypothetical protein
MQIWKIREKSGKLHLQFSRFISLFSSFGSQGRRDRVGDPREDVVDEQTSRESGEVVVVFDLIGQIYLQKYTLIKLDAHFQLPETTVPFSLTV